MYVGNLYDPSKSNKRYYYAKGWNIQAYIAYIVGIALPFTGFVGTLGPKVSTTATRMGDLGWCLSFISSLVVYYCLCRIWPTENQKLIRESGLGWEELSGDDIMTIDGTTMVEDGFGIRTENETVVYDMDTKGVRG